jgi:hypothetical protein
MTEPPEPLVCPNCGHVAAEDEDRCAECSVPLHVSCPECGASARGDADDCPACGASLAHATADGGV